MQGLLKPPNTLSIMFYRQNYVPLLNCLYYGLCQNRGASKLGISINIRLQANLEKLKEFSHKLNWKRVRNPLRHVHTLLINYFIIPSIYVLKGRSTS